MSESDEPPPLPLPRERRPFLEGLAFATIYLIWGSTYLAIRIGVRTLPPFLMAGSRFLLAGAALFAVLRATGVAPPTAAQWIHAIVAGVLMLAVGNGMVSWAEQGVPSNLAALLIAAVPIYVALLEWARPGGRHPHRRETFGVVIGCLGMALLAIPGHGAARGPTLLGIGAVLLSGLAWAAGTLYARYRPRHPHTLMVSAQQMIAGGITLLLVAGAHGENLQTTVRALTWSGALAFIYLTLFGSLVAFSAYGWLVTVSTPMRLSTTAFVNPVVAVVLGWTLLGERLGPRTSAGAALIIAAVVVMTVKWQPVARASGNYLNHLWRGLQGRR